MAYYKNVKRIPRKLKKVAKKHCRVHYKWLTNEQRLWLTLGYTNPTLKSNIIDEICQKHGHFRKDKGFRILTKEEINKYKINDKYNKLI